MKAIRIHNFGPTEDVLQYEDVPVPEPKAGEVLIKVEAASLNRADLGLRKGTYRISPMQLPVIPGSRIRRHDRKAWRKCQRIPNRPTCRRLSESRRLRGIRRRQRPPKFGPFPTASPRAQAAALPTAFLTAWFGLKTDGNLKTGEWLLVQGGSSGVGTAAIQIAKHFGAKVIATTGSEENARRLRQLGADVTIDVSQDDFLAGSHARDE